jgi:hypothetical protein
MFKRSVAVAVLMSHRRTCLELTVFDLWLHANWLAGSSLV